MPRYSGTVHVYEGQYYLWDGDQSPYPPYREPPTGLVALAVGGGISVSSATNTGHVRLAIELRTDEPPVPSDDWDEIVDVSHVSVVGDTRLYAWGGAPTPDLPSLSHAGPGEYRLRFHARHRDDPRNASPFTTVEEHEITVWPAPAGPTVVHKATDAFGAGLRSYYGNGV